LKKKNEIYINESFKNFVLIILGLNIKNLLFINSNDYETVRKQFHNLLLDIEPFG
jgi:hypothetical protein